MTIAAPERTGAERRFDRVTALLADEIGPRRPTSPAERIAAARVLDELGAAGVASTRLEPFRGCSSFAWPYGAIMAAAVGAGAVPRRYGRLRAGLGAGAALAGALEDGLRLRPLSRACSWRRSVNLLASVDARRPASRTLCLVSHLDSSRSGLMFHLRALPYLQRIATGMSVAVGLATSEPLLERLGASRHLTTAARGALLAGLGILAERELAGHDVPGANDNASGVALCATLMAEVATAPLAETRVVMLATGCEEAGVLGADAFARAHPEAAEWIFLNFDGVAAPGTLRFLRREGVTRKWAADPGLVALCQELACRRPELGLKPSDGEAGLTYDSSPLLARGWRAITLGVSDGVIPNYHAPTDTTANLDRRSSAIAIEVGRELIAAVDSGALDGPG